MSKPDPLELHRKFVEKMMMGVAFAIAGIAAGYAFSSSTTGPVTNIDIAAIDKLDDAMRSTTRVERNALRTAANIRATAPSADRQTND